MSPRGFGAVWIGRIIVQAVVTSCIRRKVKS